MKKFISVFFMVLICAGYIFSQTEEAYGKDDDSKKLFDPSRLDISHSMSFGMSSTNSSDLKSQSLYSTMMQYQFSKPVTLNLSFGLPIHSTYNSAQNLNQQNITSADYFKGMPFSASLTWEPSDNFLMQISVGRYSGGYNPFFSPAGYFHQGNIYDSRRMIHRIDSDKNKSSEESENNETDKESN